MGVTLEVGDEGKERRSQWERRERLERWVGGSTRDVSDPVSWRYGGSGPTAGVLVLGVDSGSGDAGTEGRGFDANGTESADPISESVSERTVIRSEGAMAGM